MNTPALLATRSRLLNGPPVNLKDEETTALLELLNDKLGFVDAGTIATPIAPLPGKNTPHKIALCLGHARSGDEGAESVGHVYEEAYNKPILERIAGQLRAAGHEVTTLTSYKGSGYTKAMEWLAAELLSLKATCAVELHFNASDSTARGHEFLHWNNSTRGVTLAKSLLNAFDKAFPEHPSRGTKPKSPTDRGALFLSLTHCPSVIAEPFFGDNPAEWNLFSGDAGKKRLVDAYVQGITDWIAKS